MMEFDTNLELNSHANIDEYYASDGDNENYYFFLEPSNIIRADIIRISHPSSSNCILIQYNTLHPVRDMVWDHPPHLCARSLTRPNKFSISSKKKICEFLYRLTIPKYLYADKWKSLRYCRPTTRKYIITKQYARKCANCSRFCWSISK